MEILDRRLSQTGALALAMAIRLLFPEVKISRIKIDALGFCCEWEDPSLFSSSLLSLLGQKLKEVIGLSPSFKLMEMVPASAKELFLYHKSPLFAEQIEEESGPYSIWRIVEWEKEFFPCQTLPFSLEKAKHIALLGFTQEKKKIAVRGMAFSSSIELKKFLKKRAAKKEREEGRFWKEELDLIKTIEEKTVYLSRGIIFRQLLEKKQSIYYEKLGFSPIELPTEITPTQYFLHTMSSAFFSKGIAWNFCQTQTAAEEKSLLYIKAIEEFTCLPEWKKEWILVPSSYQKRQLRWQKALEKNQISYLKGDELGWDIEGSKGVLLQLYFSNECGQSYRGGWVFLGEKQVTFSLVGETTNWMENLLIYFQGNLPWDFLPIHAHVFFPFEGGEKEKNILLSLLKKEGVRFEMEEGKNISLAKKIHRALRLKVPYVIVFGKKEQKGLHVALRVRGSSKEKRLSLSELETVLRAEKEQRKFEN